MYNTNNNSQNTNQENENGSNVKWQTTVLLGVYVTEIVWRCMTKGRGAGELPCTCGYQTAPCPLSPYTLL